MKKLMISLRHPGPCQNIFPVLDALCEKYEVSVLISDSAISYAKSWKGNLEKVLFYTVVLENGEYRFLNGFSHGYETACLEFRDDEMGQYNKLYKALYEFIEKENPDIVLRTTPVFYWGIDELLPKILTVQGKSERLRCYQECYCAGKALIDHENRVADTGCKSLAVVDECAAKYSTVSDTTVVGYLSSNSFFASDFYEKRRSGRRKLALCEQDKVFLYVASCIYDIEMELYHFRIFLNQAKCVQNQIKIYLKFHPRHSEIDRKQYMQLIHEIGCEVVILKEIDYEELLSFSDCMISLGSSVNIDAVNFVSFASSDDLKTSPFVSVYPYGDSVKKVMKRIFLTENYPAYDEDSCHVIVPENSYQFVFDEVICGNNFSQSLFMKYKKNKKNFSGVLSRFVDYLGKR